MLAEQPNEGCGFEKHVLQAINYHQGAMEDAAATISERMPTVRTFRLTVSHRLPLSVIEFVHMEVVDAYPQAFIVVDGEIERIVPETGAKVGMVKRKNAILEQELEYPGVHGILYRNNKEGRLIFTMLLRRGYDCGLRYDGKLLTARKMLLDLCDTLKKECIIAIDRIYEWTYARTTTMLPHAIS